MPAGDAGFRWAAKASASVAICLAGAAAGTGLYLGNQAFIQHAQPSAEAGCPRACVTDGSYAFEPAMASVERAIEAENARVRARGRYVSIALLDPFTYPAGDTGAPRWMIDQLRGAYLAQRALNAQHSLGVQLLLANEGTAASEFHGQSVRQLEALKTPDHLVAVAGMTISSLGTADAAGALSAGGVPTFGVATADQFSGHHFLDFEQVAPDDAAQAGALLGVLGRVRSAILISGEQPGDLSVDGQRDVIQAEFIQSGHIMIPEDAIASDPFVARIELTDTADRVCAAAAPPVVFYDGDPATLPVLISQLQVVADCAEKKITIATTDADDLDPAMTRVSRDGAQVSVVYAGVGDRSSLTVSFVASYQHYLGALDPGSAGLADPVTIATYDSVEAAGDAATDLTASRGQAGVPTMAGVRAVTGVLNGKLAPAGASGPLELGANGQLQVPDIPVYEDANGVQKLLKP